ncbi:DUF4949 domain-containing protein [Legionella longbeachae]|uniref:Hemin binding protein (Hbp) homolog n=1 Tax=Legionella longbeachae serogroup 1 (strain NSW150) TaxID=661367 RepID=D3HQN4_LEGLN|nr:DUF4949 domain-containing protein [Legionella longbeachae]VEE01720.1 hemin binding protein (Hbp) homolog [Legionella oakridgensis]ARB91946.1 DUF4949 domain-containing protein [Legionella longbeachae]ARM34870.1 DUF4949 domain-containing protein [Legionella longbeachae]EEZ95682.1 conserved hypothetical protein [Legionella longbeachae D-4968]QIN31646.1 DUF4949 domain-containing protein [Legionella longbeachae]
MSLGTKLASFTAALICAGSTFAQDVVCPDLSEIQKIGINKATIVDRGYYIGYANNHYNTDSNWSFAIGPVKAHSENETIERTNSILAKMTGIGVPDSYNNDVICVYESGERDVLAIAITGSYEISPMKLKQLMYQAH